MEGNELRKLRRGSLDLTQEELAAQLGTCARSISAYENSEQPIPSKIALAVECLVLRKLKPPL